MPDKMPYADRWRHELATQLDPGPTAALLARVEVRFLKMLGRLPFFFILLRATTRRFMRRNFPPQGWQLEWPDEGPDVVAFDLKSCSYLDGLAEYGAPEPTAVYCRLDDLVYEDFSPYVRWERTRTMGRGDDCCDFRFRRV